MGKRDREQKLWATSFVMNMVLGGAPQGRPLQPLNVPSPLRPWTLCAVIDLGLELGGRSLPSPTAESQFTPVQSLSPVRVCDTRSHCGVWMPSKVDSATQVGGSGVMTYVGIPHELYLCKACLFREDT